MNKNKVAMRLSIGATSIFMIFVILVMCVLAVLSYLRANSYYESTLRQADITRGYYEVESDLLSKYYLLNKDNLEQNMGRYHIVIDGNTYRMEENIRDDQILQLSFVEDGQGFEIIGLKTINQEE